MFKMTRDFTKDWKTAFSEDDIGKNNLLVHYRVTFMMMFFCLKLDFMRMLRTISLSIYGLFIPNAVNDVFDRKFDSMFESIKTQIQDYVSDNWTDD